MVNHLPGTMGIEVLRMPSLYGHGKRSAPSGGDCEDVWNVANPMVLLDFSGSPWLAKVSNGLILVNHWLNHDYS